jgi:hypothetical protein
VDAFFDPVKGSAVSQTSQPDPETHAYQLSINNSTLQGAPTVQQNIYINGVLAGGLPAGGLPAGGLPAGGFPSAVPSHINQHARVAINYGHNINIDNPTGQHGAANGYTLDEVHVQAPCYQAPASFDFVYGRQGFEQGVEFVAPHQIFGDQLLASTGPQKATTQGGTIQRVEAPALLGPAQFTPATCSTAKALSHKNGPPLFTNLPRSMLAPVPVVIGGALQPGMLLPPTSAFASRASDDSRYGDQLVGRPAYNVEPPRYFDISMLEINTFFPRWFLLPEVAMRAQVNGWDRKEVAKAQLRAKNQLGNISADNFQRAQNRIQKCFSEGGKLMFQIPIGKEAELLPEETKKELKWTKDIVESSNFPKDNLTAVNWHLRSYYKSSTNKREEHFGHIPLVEVWSGVKNWPEGDDRMILTKCLEFSRDNHGVFLNRGLQLDTSHFSWIIQQLNLAQGEFQTSDTDKAALARFKVDVPDPVI